MKMKMKIKKMRKFIFPMPSSLLVCVVLLGCFVVTLLLFSPQQEVKISHSLKALDEQASHFQHFEILRLFQQFFFLCFSSSSSLSTWC